MQIFEMINRTANLNRAIFSHKHDRRLVTFEIKQHKHNEQLSIILNFSQ